LLSVERGLISFFLLISSLQFRLSDFSLFLSWAVFRRHWLGASNCTTVLLFQPKQSNLCNNKCSY